MENSANGFGDLVGVIQHRLLINQLVDPAEVAGRLPEGLRPHVSSSGGVVVGCCLLEIESARPWPMPERVGRSVRAAAHRIAAERTDSSGGSQRVVYVPVRHTDGLLPVIAGGRVFPGVHRRAVIEVSADVESVSWSVAGSEHDGGFNIRATASRRNATAASSEIADIVIGTELGISPGHRIEKMEGAELRTASPDAESVELTLLESDFLNSFTTAKPAETLLMTDVGINWRRAAAS